MKMKITLLLFVCMAMSAGATRNFNEAGSPLPDHGEDVQYPPPSPPPVHLSPPSPSPVHRSPHPPPVHHRSRPPHPRVHHRSRPPHPPVHHRSRPPHPPVHHHSRPPPPSFSPPPQKQFSPPPPVNTKPPPSPSAPQQPSGEFNDPVQCETALARIDNCVGDLITYFFSNSNSVGEACCNRAKQLSEPCFARAFMDEPSYYNQVIKLCS
ncbi:hypothetical protein POM88_043718 [Heracleum sosnowskyi]|uniref:Prolamin-like domain-containing protein n=1 Tax=Heracleum sosnowskyi TaxID=360622 RepID=A0AAD8H2L4_9APIA|nr:hypothetical protein POM88_043718 [Heracleum sosnowskyi]